MSTIAARELVEIKGILWNILQLLLAETEESKPEPEEEKLIPTFKPARIDKEGAIKLMKGLKAQGGTYKEIAKYFNENNVTTFSGSGIWHAQTIHRLVRESKPDAIDDQAKAWGGGE